MLTSVYSMVDGIPVPLAGAVYYLAIAVGALIFLEARLVSRSESARHFAVLKWALLATVLGFLASLYFLYLQAFVLHSFCQYCLGSLGTSTILFVTALLMLWHGLE